MLIDKMDYELTGHCDRSEDELNILKDTILELMLLDVHIRGDYDGVEIA